MKALLSIVAALLVIQSATAQSHQSIKAIEVKEVNVFNSFGYLAGYSVTFKNNSAKTIDYIGWTTNYFDNSGKLIKSEQNAFNSDSLVDPIVSGFDKTLFRTPGIKSASKVQIIVLDAHSVDGTKYK
jgi:hypothetical protein